MKKHATVLILLATVAAAEARPIYRCQDASGQLFFQSRPCTSGFWERTRREPRPLAPAPHAVSLHETAPATADDNGRWTALPPSRLAPRSELRAETSRLRTLQRSQDERKALARAENYHRCRDAMRVAALCGKNQGMFICDDEGFRPAGTGAPSAFQRLDNDERYTMEQCALQARTAY